MHRPFDDATGDGAPPPRPHPVGLPAPWGGAPEPDPAQVDPAVLGALLDRHGWRRRGGAPGRYGRWTPPGPAAAAGPSLLLPQDRAYPDSEELLAEALTALGRSPLPSAREVLVALAVPSDEIRWWRAVPEGPSGVSSWAAQEQLRSAVGQMLTAGALAVRARSGYHGARRRRQARAALSGVLVGPAAGGRELTAFVPVRTGRAVAVRLCHALHAAREAIDYRRAAGGMDAFDTAVRAGVSRELTESVIALVRGSEGARIALDWSPAAGVPRGCGVRTDPVEFSAGDLAALREAGACYLRAEPSVPVVLTGTVVRMRRSGPRGPGTVRLRVLSGAEVGRVRVALDEEAYRTAGHAHLDGLPVRVAGRLESRGGFRNLAGAEGLVPVPLDDAERDRLMKSLHESPDCCEEGGDGEEERRRP
ncbi:hypothetical protein NPS70_14030 [Streptomyces sp. C10-9-1]|uniref:hypothetical protein n=1 Tax=Streptomyces sp. C10-9-1 TaxID=1859285 RepID=UPI0021128D8C|nr:hypothetical protein [Streptomyces sp. C10-9-1]MCQ6554301.1 hypothetical protein [Streptomyces sp. C10-9-1]